MPAACRAGVRAGAAHRRAARAMDRRGPHRAAGRRRGRRRRLGGDRRDLAKRRFHVIARPPCLETQTLHLRARGRHVFGCFLPNDRELPAEGLEFRARRSKPAISDRERLRELRVGRDKTPFVVSKKRLDLPLPLDDHSESGGDVVETKLDEPPNGRRIIRLSARRYRRRRKGRGHNPFSSLMPRSCVWSHFLARSSKSRTAGNQTTSEITHAAATAAVA